MRILVFVFCVCLIPACQTQSVKEKHYIDLDSLVTVQVDHLRQSNASLKKEATIGSSSSSSSTILDSTAWSHELDVFRQLDLINRPIFRDAYKVTDGTKDTKSNLLIRSYEASAGSPVPYLRLYYQVTPLNIKKLEARYQETNSLYASERILEMYFDDATGKPYLTGYLIEGNQKMMLSDSVHYIIRSEVILPKH